MSKQRKNSRFNQIKELESHGFKVKYEYIGNMISPRAGCLCCIFHGDDLVSMGISICSMTDLVIKTKAKSKAFWRAYKAYKTKITSEEINIHRLGEKWKTEFIQRSVKIKSDEEGMDVYAKIAVMMNKIYHKNGIRGKINYDVRKVFFQVPKNYNMFLVKKKYDFKSIYLG
jgi:hypothetical protein